MIITNITHGQYFQKIWMFYTINEGINERCAKWIRLLIYNFFKKNKSMTQYKPGTWYIISLHTFHFPKSIMNLHIYIYVKMSCNILSFLWISLFQYYCTIFFANKKMKIPCSLFNMNLHKFWDHVKDTPSRHYSPPWKWHFLFLKWDDKSNMLPYLMKLMSLTVNEFLIYGLWSCFLSNRWWVSHTTF